MLEKIIAAGSGGQGALRIGQMIAYAATDEAKKATWLPSYGAEMRGGTANCSVIVSDKKISSPMIMKADFLIIMNNASLKRFAGNLKDGGILIIDSDMVTDPVDFPNAKVYKVPADKIAEEEGNTKGVNMVMLGAYLALSDKVSADTVNAVIDHSFTGSKAKFAEPNRRLVKRGIDFIKAL